MPLPRIRIADLVRQATARPGPPPPQRAGRGLHELNEFGPNPGALRLFHHIPDGLPPGAPLVVVLHGCRQDAAGFAHATGWAALADAHGFAVLAPGQTPTNNANACFNWFEAADQARHGGEVESIRAMVAALVDRHRLDAGRVFVTGLSAGGAMAAALLATWPDVFAGGAIVAGLPYGVAASVPEAFEAMRGDRRPGADALVAYVRTASRHRGPWPRIAIWQGDADHTVAPVNADLLVAQWAGLHGLPSAPTRREGDAGHRVSRWVDTGGRVMLERHDLAGFGHGAPIAAGTEAGRCGEAAPFVLDVGVNGTQAVAAFFGIAPPPPPLPARAAAFGVDAAGEAGGASRREAPWASSASFADETIRRALAAAGLTPR